MQKVKYREMGLQILIFILTIGLYTIYWFYQTAEEMKDVTSDKEASPTLWTACLFIPFANLYAYFKYSELYEKIGSENVNKWILFILWLFFSPAIWFLVQKDLNRLAKAEANAAQKLS